MKQFITKHFFLLATIGILLIAIALRFSFYDNRWIIAYDQAHDALIADYAVSHLKLPLMGPFSSAGPFQTGGEWYWLLMVGTAIAPSFLLSPWLLMTSLYVVFLYLIIRVGIAIGGKPFGLIAGLLAALSPSQINQGLNLTNQSPQALLSLLAIWAMIYAVQKGLLRYYFLLGLYVGIASSIHLSGIALGALIISLFIINRKITIQSIGLILLGIALPWVPVLFMDMQHHFMNTSNMIRYYLHDQHAIPLEVLGRRWLTYLGVFWPTQWAFVIGGLPFIGYGILASFVSFIFLRKSIPKEIVIVMASTILMIIILRYTHTPIFESYLVFMHPFILLLTAWVAYLLVKAKKIAVVFLLVIIAGSLYKDYTLVTARNNESARLIERYLLVLEKKYAGKKFAVYNYEKHTDKWKDKNYILTLYLTKQDKIDKNGVRVSIVNMPFMPAYVRPIAGQYGTLQLASLESSSSAALEKHGWTRIDAEKVYKETEEWSPR